MLCVYIYTWLDEIPHDSCDITMIHGPYCTVSVSRFRIGINLGFFSSIDVNRHDSRTWYLSQISQEDVVIARM